VLAAGGSLAAGVSVSAALAAGGSTPTGGPAAAVVYRISTAQQRATLAYWTRGRMLAVTSGVVPRAAAANVQPPKGIPTAVHFAGVPTTGALFFTTGGKAHYCTASVVNSAVRDLLLTAAHCVYQKGPVRNIEYVPEYHNGHLPFGAWTIQGVNVARSWINSHNVNFDFAFLSVAQSNGKNIQAVTGGLTMRFNLWYSQNIEVIGYNDTDNNPISCATKSFRYIPGQMEFYCHGFWDGTSGGPWIIGYNAKTGTGNVFGVIGGFEQGGTYDWASYSSYFNSQTRALFVQAATPPPTPTPTPTPTTTQTQTAAPAPAVANGALQDLRPVHLAQRVGDQL
jgi:V8-like Glu-specific endopeptidase